jgi:hypothetical protein
LEGLGDFLFLRKMSRMREKRPQPKPMAAKSEGEEVGGER